MSNTFSVRHDAKFGGIILGISINDFNALVFSYGDSLDFSLSNGVILHDIPYFNGLYTKTGEILCCGYPGYPGPRVCRKNGDDLWDELGVNAEITVTVSLSEAGKYKGKQDALNMAYSNAREDFPSDEAFANFRALSGGRMKRNVLFRSASPVNNEYNRAPTVSALVEKHGIRTIINLSDDEAEFRGCRVSPYIEALYKSGGVFLLSMNGAYRSPAFKQKVVRGLRGILSNGLPALIHCTEGKDRTGIVAYVLEALCGASLVELQSDYMKSYDNYYFINKTNTPERYSAVVDAFFNDFSDYFKAISVPQYLLDGGMTETEISALLSLLCE